MVIEYISDLTRLVNQLLNCMVSSRINFVDKLLSDFALQDTARSNLVSK